MSIFEPIPLVAEDCADHNLRNRRAKLIATNNEALKERYRRGFGEGCHAMDYAELAEFIAALILDRKHQLRCATGCLCKQLREVKEVRDALTLLEARKVLQA